MAKFAINASGAMLLPSLVQVSESISGSVVPLAMFYKFVLRNYFFRHYNDVQKLLYTICVNSIEAIHNMYIYVLTHIFDSFLLTIED